MELAPFEAAKLKNLSILPGALFVREDLVHRLQNIVSSPAHGKETVSGHRAHVSKDAADSRERTGDRHENSFG